MMSKPSRSDEILDFDQQLHITNQVRAHFDALAPKRPPKPNRSESDSNSESEVTLDPGEDIAVPELDKFRSLQSQSHAIISEEKTLVQEEFVETQYYKELNSIDKHHHTTGTGFIKVSSKNSTADQYVAQPKEAISSGGIGGHRQICIKTNPATNDWIPTVDGHQDGYVSLKPNRSESS